MDLSAGLAAVGVVSDASGLVVDASGLVVDASLAWVDAFGVSGPSGCPVFAPVVGCGLYTLLTWESVFDHGCCGIGGV